MRSQTGFDPVKFAFAYWPSIELTAYFFLLCYCLFDFLNNVLDFLRSQYLIGFLFAAATPFS